MQGFRGGLQRSRDDVKERHRKARHLVRAKAYEDIVEAMGHGMPILERHTPRGSDDSQATVDPDAPKVNIIDGSATTMSTPLVANSRL